MANLENVSTKQDDKKEELLKVLGVGYKAASSKSIMGTYEILDTLIQVLYLNDFISAHDVKDILDGKEIL